VDDLQYKYDYDDTRLVRNRLYAVLDEVPSGDFDDDIDGMTFLSNEFGPINQINNYSYDKEGRLIKDEQEEIAEIKWRVDGKVSEIKRYPESSKENLKFDYNAMGQRIAKHVYDNQTGVLKKSTYYILDAQGNQMSMYEHKVGETSATFTLEERNIYGSSRLGVLNDSVDMFNPEPLPSYGVLGNRSYELTNHLGNVLAVVSDNYFTVEAGSHILEYRAGLNQVYDYSPFGVQLKDRTLEPEAQEITETAYVQTDEMIYASNFNINQSQLSNYDG